MSLVAQLREQSRKLFEQAFLEGSISTLSSLIESVEAVIKHGGMNAEAVLAILNDIKKDHETKLEKSKLS